jgi:hypothetical protein
LQQRGRELPSQQRVGNGERVIVVREWRQHKLTGGMHMQLNSQSV